MTKKMLIDASHAEETRVVVLDGNRLEDFDVETANRKQIKGNIYLAKVIRVEPSLQAAFVEYGGNRHGFLAFGEIHPDYYQIPVADRKRLLAMQAEEEAAEEADSVAEVDDAPAEAPAERAASGRPLEIKPIEIHAEPPPEDAALPEPAEFTGGPVTVTAADAAAPATTEPEQTQGETAEAAEPPAWEVPAHGEALAAAQGQNIEQVDGTESLEPENEAEQPAPESLGGDGDDAAEARERRQRQRFLRNYKIQDVIHRRQIMLIQVVKEERGNKGAALTTYLSLAGRFSVLMPNSPSGGGVSRKITSVADRRRLKEAMAELDVPEGMGLIVRTAGANRPKPEIKRDCEYLLRLWDDIRDRTMESTAPALIYEEASLIKRSIRDVYTRDVEEILVDGEEGFRSARDFMRMLMPAHARKVQLWTEGQPLFAKHQVEAQLDAMLNPTVQLRSGGYIVINQTEALVAIDVNSGRSTRERSIEDTALRTNLEAAEEAAKQLRMRDLAGLIVIDFIDMESRKNNAAVERKLKDALKNDRARIQVGSISHFGLMEMSRQRLRPSLAEASLVTCPHCAGMGHIRSPESAALHILRAIEDEGGKFRAAEIAVVLPPEIAFYLFNHKRERLSAIEARYAMRVIFTPDAAMTGTNFRIEKIKAQTASAPPPAPASYAPPERAVPERKAETVVEDDADEDEAENDADASNAAEGSEEGDRKRRRRRRRGKRRADTAGEPSSSETGQDVAEAGESGPTEPHAERGTERTQPLSTEDAPNELDLALAAELSEPETPAPPAEGDEPAPRRRRTRGGRRRRTADAPTDEAAGESGDADPEAAPPPAPVYRDVADIFDAAERLEDEARQRRRAATAVPATAAPATAPPTTQVAELAVTQVVTTESSAAEPASEPVGEPAPAVEDAVEDALEPALETASVAVEASDAPAPLVKPIVIGENAPASEKKRGWWRR
jgi:ribonuclease E